MALAASLKDCVGCKWGRIFSRHGRGYIFMYFVVMVVLIWFIKYEVDRSRQGYFGGEIHWRAVTTECHAMIRQNPMVAHYRKMHKTGYQEGTLHRKKTEDLEGDALCKLYRETSKIRRKVITNVLDAVVHKHAFLVTYVTQLSSDRLDRLHEAINHWTGPVSAAIYLKEEHFADIDRLICGFPLFVHRRDVFIHLIPETTNSGEMYPINYLRNVALHHASTDYVFLADVDFVPMPGIHNRLLTDILKLRKHDKQALIVPAFEVMPGHEITSHNKPYGKVDILNLWHSGVVEPFHFSGFFHGHKPTNFSLWSDATHQYEIEWQRWFEPYVVVKRKEVPTFNEQFVERGFDKSSFIMQLAALKYKFVVLPDVFILHIPHAEDRTELYRSQGLHKCARETFDKFRSELIKRYNFNEHFHASELGHLEHHHDNH